jgi:two-component sensor histidine kinase
VRQLWCDARVLALWGWQADAKPTLDGLFAAVHPEDAAGARKALDAALDPGGTRRYAAEFRVRPADGKAERWIRAKGVTTQAADDGKATGQAAERRVVITVQDVTERHLAEARLRLLMRELSHRVNNTLAVVQSLAQLSLRDSGAKPEVVQSFLGRLQALAVGNKQLVDGDWQSADIANLVREQMAPYIGDADGRLRLEGPSVRLPATSALEFGLLLHELATNALRHGALSNRKGRVEISWKHDARDGVAPLTVVWAEREGPKVAPPKNAGFGSFLIEKGLSEGRVTREFRPTGLVCTIEMPLASTPASAPHSLAAAADNGGSR